MLGSQKVPQNRRTFLKSSALGALAFTVANSTIFLTPRQARAADVPLRVLTPEEAQSLEALGETIHPGAAEAGLVQFIDQQLAIDPDDCRSLVKYFVNDPPFADFYRAGVRSLEGLSLAKHKKSFSELEPETRTELVRSMGQDNPQDWAFPPPAPLFYMVVRNDTTDVLYGTIEGFRRLGIPYMPHIVPTQRW